MTEEFNLSKKRWKTFNANTIEEGYHYSYNEKDIKEFIKRLKEILIAPYKNDFNSPLMQITSHDEMCFELCDCVKLIEKEIDKLAGDSLK